MSSAERISFLQEKLQEIRKYYMSLKSEVATIDRRRKRLKKKDREGNFQICFLLPLRCSFSCKYRIWSNWNLTVLLYYFFFGGGKKCYMLILFIYMYLERVSVAFQNSNVTTLTDFFFIIVHWEFGLPSCKYGLSISVSVMCQIFEVFLI